MAGIHGSEQEGCYSLALSGGYEDDIDLGDSFTYTGEGRIHCLFSPLSSRHRILYSFLFILLLSFGKADFPLKVSIH